MGIRDLFSKRAANAKRAGQPDVYRYDELPHPFRVQVVHIWQRAIGDAVPMSFSRGSGPPQTLWVKIEQTVAEEHGLFRLGEERGAFERCANYFLKIPDTDKALDVIEATFATMNEDILPELERGMPIGVAQLPGDAIVDLNRRFREHAIGYQYVAGNIIRVDSQYVHAEAVKPALRLLNHKGFAGPEQEFLNAHRHYREGNNKEAINDALKSFESTMKAICDARRWPYDKNKATAKILIDLVLKQGLVPEYLDGGLGGLRACLEALVPTTRNRTSGHGQGSLPREVPEHLAAYVLHVTASTIVMLVSAHLDKKTR